MSEDSELDNFEVFFVVSMFFIGVVSVIISVLSDLSAPYASGILVMVFALYYRRRLLRLRGGA